MAKELRQISFSPEEIQEAIIGYCQDYGIHMPFGQVKGMSVDLGNDPALVLVFDSKIENEKPEKNVSLSELTAALVYYCKSHNIMLPRLAPKILQDKKSGLSMTLSYQKTPNT